MLRGSNLKSFSLALLFGLVLTFGGYGEAAAQPKPCFPDLASCPAHGCAKPDSPEGIVNELKRTRPTSTTLVFLTLDDFDFLQEQADGLVSQNKPLSKSARKKLRQLQLRSSEERVSEGDLIQIIGFIVGLPDRPKASGPESVNCRLSGSRNNDFHIPIAVHPDDGELNSIVVKMIPQDRPEEWTAPKLRSVARRGLMVLVRGQLFYDNKHLVNSDPDDVKPKQPKRFSLWEIHPVTEFHVCVTVDNNCDPKNLAQWQPLENVPEEN